MAISRISSTVSPVVLQLLPVTYPQPFTAPDRPPISKDTTTLPGEEAVVVAGAGVAVRVDVDSLQVAAEALSSVGAWVPSEVITAEGVGQSSGVEDCCTAVTSTDSDSVGSVLALSSGSNSIGLTVFNVAAAGVVVAIPIVVAVDSGDTATDRVLLPIPAAQRKESRNNFNV